MFGTFNHVGSVFLPVETSEIGGLWSRMQPGLFKAQLFIQSANYIFLSAATKTTGFYMHRSILHAFKCQPANPY